VNENPFITRNVQPGSIAFLFPIGENETSLLDRLENQKWWGQIVGPHGTGKSTLLATLIPAIERRGRHPLLIELRNRQRRIPVNLKHEKAIDSLTVLIVDGYEQLGLLSRFFLRRFCRQHGIGLVVTSHKKVGLPTLLHTEGRLKTTQQIVSQLLENNEDSIIKPDEVARSFEAHNGNVREVLFEMYDIFENRYR